MKILVCSCDKNVDLFLPFHHCMEKYGPTHPEIIYSTESVDNPYYRTVRKNYPLIQGTRRMRETLADIDDEDILIMMDDLFLCGPVDLVRLQALEGVLQNTNIACLNMEQSFDPGDQPTTLEGFKRRQHGARYEVSIMCGLGDRKKLMKILEDDSDPGTVEKNRDAKGFDFYINAGNYIIDGGYKTFKPTGCYRGKGMHRTVEFLKAEGLDIDFSRRGIFD